MRRPLFLAVVAIASGAAIAVPGSASAANCGPLRTSVRVQSGDNGPAVSAVQCALKGRDEAFANLVIDGRFGSRTASAVKLFQTGLHLSADGVVGPATYRGLTGALDYDRTSIASGPTLRVGDRGQAVQAAQDALGVPADGIFGRRTESAVADFQGRQGLLVDGVLGPRTRARMAAAGLGRT